MYSLYLLANTIALIYPSQHSMIHWDQFTRSGMLFENRKCWHLWRPKWMNSWQENSISYKNKRLIKFVPQWRFSCTGLTTLVHHIMTMSSVPEKSSTGATQIVQCLPAEGKWAIAAWNPSHNLCYMESFQWNIPTSWATTIPWRW